MTDIDKIPAERIVATGDGWLVERNLELNVYLVDADRAGTLVAYAWGTGIPGDYKMVLCDRIPMLEEWQPLAYFAAMSALRDAVQPKAVAA